ncbi:MAG: hypothetical protein Q8S00_04055 [Deltaproteobacteria bacterium]|nr:hypothetical protein [Deltaproteobacteria bacterium]
MVEPILARRAAEVGRDDHIGKLEQRVAGIDRFLVKGVETVTSPKTSGSERFMQRLAVDELRLADVDQESSGFDERRTRVIH